MQWTRSQSFGLLQLSRTVIGGAGVGAPRNGKKEKPMSVRMALAKLCACTCGGAIIGSGAMKITDVPATAQVQTRSEEHPSELQSLMRISYAVFCFQKKNSN